MKFLRLAIIFLLFLRVATFFFTKPILKTGAYVKVSSILTARPKIAFTKLQFKLNDQLVEIDMSQVKKLKYKTGELMFKRVAVYGPVINRNKNLVIIAKRIVINDAGILGRILKFFNFISEFVENTCFEIFPADEAGIMIGILLGESGFVSHNLYEAFKTAGVLHLFAASGMNLVIFGGFIRQLLILFMKRVKAEALTVISVIFYVFLSGFSPSIVRAGVMFLAVFGAAIFGRPLKAERNLFFAAAMLIFVNPELLFNLGFQLSVLSTLGLIVSPFSHVIPVPHQTGEGLTPAGILRSDLDPGSFISKNNLVVQDDNQNIRKYPIFSNGTMEQLSNGFRSIKKIIFKFAVDVGKMLSSDFQTSLSCFLFTAPLIIFSFGQINLLAIVVNVLVLWTVDLMMIGGGILVILRAIGFEFVKPLAFLMLPLIVFFKQIILKFSNYNFGVIKFDWHGNTVLFLIFCLICWIGFLIKTEKKANGEPNQYIKND